MLSRRATVCSFVVMKMGILSYRVNFNPTLYVPTKNYSEWRTLEGDCVEPVKQGSINDAKEFIKRYRDVEDFDIYGNSRFLYQYIAEEYPQDELKFDSSAIRIFNIDIETAAENGFPDIETADQAILAISIKDSFHWSHCCVRGTSIR